MRVPRPVYFGHADTTLTIDEYPIRRVTTTRSASRVPRASTACWPETGELPSVELLAR